MKKIIFTAIGTLCLICLVGCGKKNNIEAAHKLVEEQGDKIEVANILVSDTIMVDSLDARQMVQLEECLVYIKGAHEQLEPEVREHLDYVIHDKIKNNLDNKGTTVGGELIDNPDSEIVTSPEEE